MVYHRYPWKVFWILMTYRKCQLLDTDGARGLLRGGNRLPVTYSCSRSELRNPMERSDFHVMQIRAEHIFPYQIQDIIVM